jgi:hypothetical protein
MDEEFKDKDFYMKLFRLGAKHPEVKSSAREILQYIEKHREDGEDDE